MILNQFGKPIPAAKKATRYAGALSSRLTDDWLTTMRSEDSMARWSLQKMRDRARDLCRKDDYAKRFLAMVETHVVGPTGFKLQMDVFDWVKDKSGGFQKKPDHQANDIIEEAWRDFSMPENFTVTGQYGRQTVEALVAKTMARDGEFLVRIIRGFPGKYGIALQPLEVDLIDTELNDVRGGNEIRMGVEYNSMRRPVAYWLLKTHPGDDFQMANYRREHDRVPAGEIIHGFIPLYMLQTRGITWFHTALLRLQMLHGYEEAELTAARTEAAKMGFLFSDGDSNPQYTGDGTDAEGDTISEAEPGIIERLPHGMKFQSWDPTHPSGNYSDFRKAILRGVAAGLNVGYNSLASDLEGVNYSSLRSGALEERDTWMQVQEIIKITFCRRVFREWLSESLLNGALPLPAVKFEKFNRPKFSGRRWQWVDPQKDVQAHILALNNSLTTRTKIIGDAGGDFDETMREIARERETAESLGINLDAAPATAPSQEHPPPDDSAPASSAEE